MADDNGAGTPTDQGTAQVAYDTTVETFTAAQEAMGTAKEAFDADSENDELKLAFTEKETAFNEAETAQTSALEILEGFKNDGKGYWPEDWREKYIDGLKTSENKEYDEEAKDKMLKRLQRYGSPQAFMDAGIAAQNKIASGNMKTEFPVDGDEKEQAEWRKENGIPEKFTDYDVRLSEGRVIGDDDKEMVDSFLKDAHLSNAPQEVVSMALEWYYNTQEAQQVAQQESDAEFKEKAVLEMREEYGPDYMPNMKGAVALVNNSFGEDTIPLLMGARLADGTPLMNHPGVLRGLVGLNKEVNPIGTLTPATGDAGVKALETRKTELEGKMGEPGWHKDTASQKKYMEIVEALNKQAAKGG